MQSKAPNVTAYLAEIPEERRAVVAKLRALCRRSLEGYQEGMEYGMPTYKRQGAVEVAFASQKQYVSLYVLKKDVLDRHRSALKSCRIGKGCIRFPRPDQMDFSLVEALLRDVAQAKSEPC